MGVVGNDDLFVFDVVFAEAVDKIDGLYEFDVSVVIAVDEQDGGLPGGNVRYGGRCPAGGAGQVDIGASLIVRVGSGAAASDEAVVDAMDVDSDGEQT